MAIEEIPFVEPGDPIRASWWNALVDQVRRISRLTCEAPLEMVGDPPCIVLSQEAPKTFIVTITRKSDYGGFDWAEQRAKSDGTMEVPAWARKCDSTAGDPKTEAQELRKSPLVSANDRALMFQCPDENGARSYRFAVMPPPAASVMLTEWDNTAKTYKGTVQGNGTQIANVKELNGGTGFKLDAAATNGQLVRCWDNGDGTYTFTNSIRLLNGTTHVGYTGSLGVGTTRGSDNVLEFIAGTASNGATVELKAAPAENMTLRWTGSAWCFDHLKFY